MTLNGLTEFLGWMTILNIGILMFAFIMTTCCQNFAICLHQKIFKLSEETLREKYFSFMGQYKLAIIIFNLIPYIALKIMG